MGQIRITPEELREGASFIGQREEAIRAEVDQLKAKIDEVTSNWEGAAQSAFIAAFEANIYPVLNQMMPECIEGVIGQMNASADTMEETDNSLASSMS